MNGAEEKKTIDKQNKTHNPNSAAKQFATTSYN